MLFVQKFSIFKPEDQVCKKQLYSILSRCFTKFVETTQVN